MVHTIPSGSESYLDHNPFLLASRIARRVIVGFIFKVFRQELLSIPEPLNLSVYADFGHAIKVYGRMNVRIAPAFFMSNLTRGLRTEAENAAVRICVRTYRFGFMADA